MTHKTSIHRDEDEPGWFASCECGWDAEARRLKATAQEDARLHRADPENC